MTAVRPPTCYALVPAAGSGARFGAERPKQYLELAGKPVVHHTLAVLCRCRRIERVLLLLSPDDAFWRAADEPAFGGKLRVLRCGGATRAATVAHGLAVLADEASASDWALVHDAARPCLSDEMLSALSEALFDDPIGGLLAVPVADTLKRIDAAGRVAGTRARDGLWQAQTPQMFRLGLLREALAKNPAVTDEASAIEALGLKPKLVRADSSNLKITYPADLRLAEWILRGRIA